MSNETCGRSFDEALLTGYLDGVLTQADDQRVRLHLEECAGCRGLIEEMRQTRRATLDTRFAVPAEDQWSEAPHGLISRLSFGLGWVVLLAWTAGMLGLLVGHLWSSGMPLVEKLLLFGGLSGVALLFLSVLIDRLKIMRDDPYRRVQR